MSKKPTKQKLKKFWILKCKNKAIKSLFNSKNKQTNLFNKKSHNKQTTRKLRNPIYSKT